MSDEIKEILDNFKCYEERYKKCNETQFIIIYRDIHLLLDCIPNLQEEINKLTAENIEWKSKCYDLQEENKKLKHNLEQMYNDTKDTYNEICAEQIDYKLRIDKALKYMQDNNLSNFDSKLYYILIGSDKE